MKTSETITKISAALAAVGKEVGPAAKDGTNPHFKSAYSTLGEIIATVRTPLANHGISIVQSPIIDGATVTVETVLLHTSGEWIANECATKARDASPQSIGSAITYMRRYGLQSIACLASEDDDGEGAMWRQQPAIDYASDEQFDKIFKMARELNQDLTDNELKQKVEDFGNRCNLPHPKEWTVKNAILVSSKLEKIIRNDAKKQDQDSAEEGYPDA